jgi:hypothetical protein
MKMFQKIGISLLALFLLAGLASAQKWTPLKNQPTFSGAGSMLLLTDGRVMVHEEQSNDQNWYTLTPDASGSYINGTWKKLATMPNGYFPLFFSSAVLPDGRVLIEGGEYICDPNCSGTWTNKGAIYDPVKNKWTPVNPPSGWANIGDAQSTILNNGLYMQANALSIQQAYFNPKTLGWTNILNTGKRDGFDEEGWLLMPDGDVLTTDTSAANSEIYSPVTKKWTSGGSTIVRLSDPGSAEIGPMVLRPDGTVYATGGSPAGTPGHTAIYNTATKKWKAGPDFPKVNGVALACDDAPAALEINGNVLILTSPPVFNTGGVFFEWNGTKLTRIAGPPNANNDPAFFGHLLELPTGQLLFTDYSTDVEIFTPKGTYQSAWQPTITSVPTTLTHGQSYVVKGTQLSGLSQGSAYGDDFQDNSNYALVRITNNGTKHVFYAKTTKPSSYAVQSGSKAESTHFTVPAGIETGASSLVVVTNGIPSAATAVTVN